MDLLINSLLFVDHKRSEIIYFKDLDSTALKKIERQNLYPAFKEPDGAFGEKFGIPSTKLPGLLKLG